MFGNAAYASNAYRRLAAESSALGADSHQLIALLFTASLAAIGQARSALTRRDIAAKAVASSKAIRLVDEGLKVAVDRSQGAIGESLYQIYDYCTRRLILANAQNDDTILQEVQALIEPVAQSWKAMKQGATGA